jgi:hypothetical protein
MRGQITARVIHAMVEYRRYYPTILVGDLVINAKSRVAVAFIDE